MGEKMKILFTSVGRRVELMQAFHQAAEKNDIDLAIIGADITSTAPALQFCDKTEIVCRISDSDYIPMLFSICEKEKVDTLYIGVDEQSFCAEKVESNYLYNKYVWYNL